jgi:hypothetical protein
VFVLGKKLISSRRQYMPLWVRKMARRMASPMSETTPHFETFQKASQL